MMKLVATLSHTYVVVAYMWLPLFPITTMPQDCQISRERIQHIFLYHVERSCWSKKLDQLQLCIEVDQKNGYAGTRELFHLVISSMSRLMKRDRSFRFDGVENKQPAGNYSVWTRSKLFVYVNRNQWVWGSTFFFVPLLAISFSFLPWSTSSKRAYISAAAVQQSRNKERDDTGVMSEKGPHVE